MADVKEAEEQKWPPLWGGLSKCTAGAVAGCITGLLAGLGVAIALGKEIDDGTWAILAGGLLTLLGALGGMFTGAIAAGCYRTTDPPGK